MRTYNPSRKTNHPLYGTWVAMRQRCGQPKASGYEWYGGRGIRVCDRWQTSFENFLADMGEKPTPFHTLERKDNDGGYEPANCVWATATEQSKNRRNTRYLVIDGQRHRASDLADQSGVPLHTVIKRAMAGYSLAEVCAISRLPPKLEGLALGVDAHRIWKKSQTHCKNGHEWTPENTHITPDGHRRCRACGREYERQASMRRRH